MKKSAYKKSQIFPKFICMTDRRFFCLLSTLCLLGWFTSITQGQTNQKSDSETVSTTQTGARSQNKTGKVTVKEDEFANKKTTTLTEHSLSSIITITMKCIIDRKANRSPMERYLDFATVEFASTSGKREYGYGSEINFLVDGKPVKGNQVSSLISRRQPEIETVITTLGFDVLTKVSQGKEVKMKLGENIFVLDDKFKKLIKEFVNAAQ